MQISLGTECFLILMSGKNFALLMNVCVSNELRAMKTKRDMKNLHEKDIIDGTGFEVDSLSTKWVNMESSSSDSLSGHRVAVCWYSSPS